LKIVGQKYHHDILKQSKDINFKMCICQLIRTKSLFLNFVITNHRGCTFRSLIGLPPSVSDKNICEETEKEVLQYCNNSSMDFCHMTQLSNYCPWKGLSKEA